MHIEIDEGIRSILIVEDEMIVAMLMEELVRELGVEDGLSSCTDASVGAGGPRRQVHRPSAILDMQVRDGTTTAVADVLTEKGIPFVSSSGSDVSALPERHADRPMIRQAFSRRRSEACYPRHLDAIAVRRRPVASPARGCAAHGATD